VTLSRFNVVPTSPDFALQKLKHSFPNESRDALPFYLDLCISRHSRPHHPARI
jgi:hypothetical protein